MSELIVLLEGLGSDFLLEAARGGKAPNIASILGESKPAEFFSPEDLCAGDAYIGADGGVGNFPWNAVRGGAGREGGLAGDAGGAAGVFYGSGDRGYAGAEMFGGEYSRLRGQDGGDYFCDG